MLHRFSPVLAGALLLSPLLDAEAVRAQCTRLAQAGAVARRAGKRARCNDRALRVGPTKSCMSIPAPPPCAGNLVDEAIALAYGANDPAASTVDRRALRACEGIPLRACGVRLRSR